MQELYIQAIECTELRGDGTDLDVPSLFDFFLIDANFFDDLYRSK